MKFEKIVYSELNSKAKEMYNFQKVSAKLADYGFTTMWLNNDWQGADFIGVHADGVTDIKVQLKGRLSFSKKYVGKNIYMCFISDGDVYLYPHDEVLNQLEHRISDKTYIKTGSWSTPKLTKQNKQLLEPYLL
ncbi:hypothetical protein [Thiomicrorhabdus sp. Milos-T2]|uniref:hypothetical protein n=1 Tax=Thiomicrorhabdus sp. Milos-T2 TaxID=90814 RepID=UPI0004943B23|nr:hypothetical protein [Thiomicrorhabdus sp. Milos-T2]